MTRCDEQGYSHVKRTNFLPTRLVDISGDATKITLLVSDGIIDGEDEYATLSHCWGSKVQPTMAALTHGSLADFIAGVNTTSLPQTFQDAVWLTRRLGIRYLWVDSLCIMQDDHDDWTRESAKMCDVYRNASLTIAASRAAGSSEGFLGERKEREYARVPFCIENPSPSPLSRKDSDDVSQTTTVSGEALVFALPPRLVYDPNYCVYLEDEPLMKRAWALQERYLSRRTLHFCHDQIYFECEHSFISEDGCISVSPIHLRPFISKTLASRRRKSRTTWRHAATGAMS